MKNFSIYGYIRRIDLDNHQIRIRQSDDYLSPLVFEGLFKQELLPQLKEAYHEVLPVKLEVWGETIVDVKIDKPVADFSYEIT